jgi:hypothetical protein
MGRAELVVMVPRLPGLREFSEAKRIAEAAAQAEGISEEPEVREANDWPSQYSPTRNPQGWVFTWPETP